MSGRELRLDGPVVVVQTPTDPGDFGEPRLVVEEGRTLVFVPDFDMWRARLVDGHHPCCLGITASDVSLCDCDKPVGPLGMTPEELAAALDAHLPRLAFHHYAETFGDGPELDIKAYYLRVARAILAVPA